MQIVGVVPGKVAAQSPAPAPAAPNGDVHANANKSAPAPLGQRQQQQQQPLERRRRRQEEEEKKGGQEEEEALPLSAESIADALWLLEDLMSRIPEAVDVIEVKIYPDCGSEPIHPSFRHFINPSVHRSLRQAVKQKQSSTRPFTIHFRHSASIHRKKTRRKVGQGHGHGQGHAQGGQGDGDSPQYCEVVQAMTNLLTGSKAEREWLRRAIPDFLDQLFRLER